MPEIILFPAEIGTGNPISGEVFGKMFPAEIFFFQAEIRITGKDENGIPVVFRYGSLVSFREKCKISAGLGYIVSS